jgi:hypothetical protein
MSAAFPVVKIKRTSFAQYIDTGVNLGRQSTRRAADHVLNARLGRRLLAGFCSAIGREISARSA